MMNILLVTKISRKNLFNPDYYDKYSMKKKYQSCIELAHLLRMHLLHLRSHVLCFFSIGNEKSINHKIKCKLNHCISVNVFDLPKIDGDFFLVGRNEIS